MTHICPNCQEGGLFVPSKKLPEFVCSCFTILDFVYKDILPVSSQNINSVSYVLKQYGLPCEFCFAVNLYFHNKQKQFKDDVRKNGVLRFKTNQ